MGARLGVGADEVCDDEVCDDEVCDGTQEQQVVGSDQPSTVIAAVGHISAAVVTQSRSSSPGSSWRR
ncbi:MAG: hypothetical protein QOE09_1973 [Ilumatobacteraceae bacterium]